MAQPGRHTKGIRSLRLPLAGTLGEHCVMLQNSASLLKVPE